MVLVQDNEEGAVLALHVQPKAARTEYVGVHGDALKFRVAAPPVDGAANEEICRYLAERFGLRKGDVMVQTGQASRHKRIMLKRVQAKRVRDILGVPFSDRPDTDHR